jgi:hypothetical protein
MPVDFAQKRLMAFSLDNVTAGQQAWRVDFAQKRLMAFSLDNVTAGQQAWRDGAVLRRCRGSLRSADHPSPTRGVTHRCAGGPGARRPRTLWDRLPHLTYWTLPSLVGIPLVRFCDNRHPRRQGC